MTLTGQDYYRIGLGLLNEGNAAEALHYLHMAEAELPNDYDVLLATGRAETLAGDGGRATTSYQRCLVLAPERPEAYREWADLLRKQDNAAEARRILALGRSHAGLRQEEETPLVASWSPEASAPKAGDLAFYCPECRAPIRRGDPELSCPSCHLNLIPLLHGHIRHDVRLDGEQGFTCAHCGIGLTGKELTCPQCGMNLLTGAPPAPPDPLDRTRVGRLIKNPVALIAFVLGMLLLFAGAGEVMSLRSLQLERQRYAMSGHRAPARHAAPAFTERWHVPAFLTHLFPKPSAVEDISDREMLSKFVLYFGVIAVGGLAVVLGILKLIFDR